MRSFLDFKDSHCFLLKIKLAPSEFRFSFLISTEGLGWSGGAKVLGKLPVLGRPTNLDYSRARAYCACSRCGWGLFGHFYSHLSPLFFLPLSGRRPDID